MAPTTPAPVAGDLLYAVSGLGSSGASLSSGTVVDAVSQGIATDAAVGQAFQGGPVVNSSAQVIAVASRTYSPLGFATSGIWYLPYVEAACNQVLLSGWNAGRGPLTSRPPGRRYRFPGLYARGKVRARPPR